MEQFLNDNVMKGLCCCIIITSFLVLGLIFILGYSSLEATEYGLDYSWISKTISPQVFQNGLHHIGFGHSFLKFPKTVQTIEFSKEKNANRGVIESRTSDGLEVSLEISFQYLLQSDNLYKLYSLYGAQYPLVFQNVAIDVLTEEATKYTAYEFFWDRGRIKDDFQRTLDKIFSDICYASIQFLQLRSVDLPNLFEEAIQESEVKKQDIKKAEAELNKVRVEVDTRIKSAEFQKNVTINIAEGEAEAMLTENQAETDSLKKVQNSQTDAYKKLKKNLALENEDLMNFIKTKMIKTYDGNNLFLNIATPEPKQSQ